MSATANASNSPVKPPPTTDSPNKPSPTAKTKPSRLPAPTLFVGPPSRNASQLSVSRTLTHDPTIKPSRDPLTRTKSALRQPFNPISDTSANREADPAGPEISITSPSTEDARNGGGGGGVTQTQGSLPTARKASERSVDAKWRELQNTLNEVELTAQSTTHVFGDSHAAALSELRRAQVELARAWGRGSSNEQTDDDDDNDDNDKEGASGQERVKNGGATGPGPQTLHTLTGGTDDSGPSPLSDRGKARRRHRGGTDASSASTALSDESTSTLTEEAASSSGRGRAAFLEDETAMDVRLASERRAANEAYFRLVDGGVQEVVAKLEAVAEAMKGMEGETRSLWSATTGEDEVGVEEEGG